SYPTAYTPLPPRRPLAPLPAHLPPLFTPLPLPAALPIYGIDSVDQLRGLRSQGRLPRLGSTDVVLVIDGFGALRDDFADLDEPRSEEHTSELQSREKLVCRLLLDKKKREITQRNQTKDIR